jgi:hypothetical protein
MPFRTSSNIANFAGAGVGLEDDVSILFKPS